MIDADRLIADIRDQIAVLGADYVNALLVALFGKDVAGVSDAEVKRLVQIGMLRQSEIEGIKLAGLDPTALVQQMGALTSRLPPGELEASKDWPLDTWIKRVKREPPDEEARPEDEDEAQGLITIRPNDPKPPEGMTAHQVDAWTQARTRAGEYARGLGNTMLDDFGRITAETWDGETPTFVPEPQRRDTYIQAIQEATSEAVARGWTAKKLASEIGHRTGDWGRNLLRLARTELQGAHNDAVVMQAIKVFGPNVRIACIPQSGACDICLSLFIGDDGRPRIFTVKELAANGTNVGKRAADWKATIWPIHPHCILPGTIVSARGVVSALRAWYSGPALTITDSAGNRVPVTVNHPFLTPNGLIPAHALHVGDDLIGYARTNAALGNPSNNDHEAGIEEIFDTLAMSRGVSSRRVPASPEHLHGDGRYVGGDGEIDIVTANSFLWDGLDASISEKVGDLPLVLGLPPGALKCLGDLDPVLLSLARAAYSGMGTSGKPPPLDVVSLPHADDHGFATAALPDARSTQDRNDRITADVEHGGNPLHGHHLVQVEPRYVAGIERSHWTGHVYDLQTIYGLYMAGNVAVGNCRCRRIPVPDGFTVDENGNLDWGDLTEG